MWNLAEIVWKRIILQINGQDEWNFFFCCHVVLMSRCDCHKEKRRKKRKSHKDSLRESQQHVLDQHGADHHLLAVESQPGTAVLLGGHGDEHQAAAAHRPAGKPASEKRKSAKTRRRTQVKAPHKSKVPKAAESRNWAAIFIERPHTKKKDSSLQRVN